jgi:hypothetical protein
MKALVAATLLVWPVAAHTGIGTLAHPVFWYGRTKEKIYSQTGKR